MAVIPEWTAVFRDREQAVHEGGLAVPRPSGPAGILTRRRIWGSASGSRLSAAPPATRPVVYKASGTVPSPPNHFSVKVCSALLSIESDALTTKVVPAEKLPNSDGIGNDAFTTPLSFEFFCTICTAWKSNVTRLFEAKPVPVAVIMLSGSPVEGLMERRGVVFLIDGNDGVGSGGLVTASGGLLAVGEPLDE